MPLRILLFPLALLVALARPAESQVVRFQDELRGNVTMTGNTLGLSKAAGTNGPGDQDSIGTFLSTDPAAKTDARVVEVEIRLDDSAAVANLTNLQVEIEVIP